MTVPELETHPDRARLMSQAFTVKVGESDGEERLEKDPDFWRRVKQRGEAVEKAKKNGSGDRFSQDAEVLKARRKAKQLNAENKTEIEPERNRRRDAGSRRKGVEKDG